MRRAVFFVAFVILMLQAVADPGVGIVMDSKGNLFYTDLSQIWMIKPDGSKSIAVPNVHSHELYMDKNDQLWGEHVWFNGEQVNTWGYYLWRRSANGEIVKVKDSTAGFPEWTGFTRDATGNMYYIEKSIPTYFWKIDTAGKKTLLGSKSFQSVGRLHLTGNGDLYFNNGADLYWFPETDSIELYVKDIADTINGKVDAHSIMSIWSDSKKNLYIATGSVIKKVEKSKFIITVYRSAGNWKPAGGLIAPNGDFWVMEYNDQNEVRVNKVSAADRKSIVKENAFKLYMIPALLVAGILLLLYVAFRKKS